MTEKQSAMRFTRVQKSYERIKRQEFAELRRMSAKESLRRGIALIEQIVKWKK